MPRAADRFQLPEPVQRLILSSKCVAFIGSGPSTGNYDSWPDLVNRLCEQCGCDTRVTRDSQADAFLDAAEAAKQANEVKYYEVLGNHFGRPADGASLIYDALLSLPFECYLTVNLDPLLALKCRTASRKCNPEIHAYPSLDRKGMTNRTIHYLHGLITEGSRPEPGAVVLSRSEFEDAYSDNSNLMNLLIPTLENDPIVFVGCRLHEPVMAKVFSICKAHQQRRRGLMMKRGQTTTLPSRFILLPEPVMKSVLPEGVDAQTGNTKKAEEGYYAEMGIQVIWYPVSGGDQSAVRFALENVAELPDIVPRHDWKEGSTYAT